MIAGRTSAVTAAAIVILTAPPSVAQARRSDEVLAIAVRASPASASDTSPNRLRTAARTGSTPAGIFLAASRPADPEGQFGRQVRLDRRHGPERFPQVGPGQRVQRLGGDEVVRRLAASQLLDLVVEAERGDEAERLHQRLRLRALHGP